MEYENLAGTVKVGGDSESAACSGARTITNLKQGVRNPNRVNVFIDEKYEFSLDMAQVVELGIKVGLVVTPEKIAEYRQASEYGKLYQRALEWVLMRPRSERELRDYLRRKQRKAEDRASLGGFRSAAARELAPSARGARPLGRELPKANGPDGRDPETSSVSAYTEIIVQKLVSKGYVDDRRFAEFWVENRFVKKGVSRRRLTMELRKKGIARDIIEEVVNERDEEEEIRKMIARKKNKYTEEKLIQYLCRQGFSYSKVKEVYSSLSTSEGA